MGKVPPTLRSRAMSMPAPPSVASPGAHPPRLLEQLRQTALARFGRREPGERHADWALRYILFHGKRHPRELAAGDAGWVFVHVAPNEENPLRCLQPGHQAPPVLYQRLLH